VLVLVESYTHRTGEHCASTAMRNVLGHQGLELSEPMVFGLASGLGFYYFRDEGLSPTRMFHGRTATLEADFGRNTGVPLVETTEPDDGRAWRAVRDSIDRGLPVMISTDTFYLGYHATTSHFPGHRCVVVGYDDASATALIADRKFEAYQRCSLDELRRARNARDYVLSCRNAYARLDGEAGLDRPLPEAIRLALRRNAREMLEPSGGLPADVPAGSAGLPAGIPALRTLARELPAWGSAKDWSWAARFGYQVIAKRGSGGSFFRSIYADFLRESAPLVPELARGLPAERMDAIAARWRELAGVLKLQSERDDCAPELFVRAGRIAGELADEEERFFGDALERCPGESAMV
jgi:hypothetical protein